MDMSFNIIQVSENVEEYLFLSKDRLLNSNISDFILEENFTLIKRKVLEKVKSTLPIYINFQVESHTRNFLSLIHLKENQILIESEPYEKDEIQFSEINYEIKNIAGLLRNAKNATEVLSIACREIQAFSGFDRVLIYQFDENWNGLVVAEEKKESLGLDTYLGLYFPASDIPKQARNLYFSNPFRYIPNRKYKAAKLYPSINPLNNNNTDLSTCNLRGVAPVHIEYLGNMGMESSMSIPIIKDNNLWGLVSFHHKTIRNVNYQLRSSFEILTSIISSEISSREAAQALKDRRSLDEIKDRLLKKLDAETIQSSILNEPNSLLTLLNLSGAAILYENETHVAGDTPPKEQLYQIIQRLKVQRQSSLFSTHQLPVLMEELRPHKDTASGLIAIPISVDKNEFILGFRPEISKVINWGGNPNEAIRFEENKKNYHPRNSFALWQQTVKNTSVKWSEVELDIAESFRTSLIERILKIQTYKRVIAEEEAFKLSIVANNTTNLVFILDSKRQIEWANAAFLDTLGFKLEEIRGQSLIKLFSGFMGIADVNTRLDNVAGVYTPFATEIVMKVKEQDKFIKLNFSPLLNNKNELIKYVVVGVDITEIKEHAMELQLINSELDRFAYIVSHDLKAPLKSIEALAELLKNDLSDKNYAETDTYVELIQVSVKKMDSFITDILTYSRIAKDKRITSKINLNTMLKEILQTLNPPSSYTIYIEPDLPEIKGNKLEIFQIFSNLLSNAIRYTDRPDAQIEVYHNILDKNYLFTVKDNGPGISDEFKDKIFEMFETVPGVKKPGSTGIGLATIKKIILDFGGKIWVDSQPGNGSAFKFTLPIKE